LILSVGLGSALVYVFGGLWLIISSSNGITVGVIVAFSSYIQRLYRPLTDLSNVHLEISSALACFDRLFNYLDATIQMADIEYPLELKSVYGHIRVENVWFSFDSGIKDSDRCQWILKNISFEIWPGQMVAIVGTNGSGKTTLAYILSHFYEVCRGTVSLDEHDLRQVSTASLRKYITILTQDTFLLNDSVRNNLLFACPNATQEQMEDACKLACVDDVINNLPQGYDTIVGDKGFQLSGGEKQRLSIARMWLKDPQVIIMDEFNSQLDSLNEQHVQTSLISRIKEKKKTCLIISHRMSSSLMNADSILVLYRGELIEQGTHDQLKLNENSLYNSLLSGGNNSF